MGKTPTTSVRRFTPVFSRSGGLVDQSSSNEPSGTQSRRGGSHGPRAATVRPWVAAGRIVAITSHSSWTCSASGWAKLVWISATTSSANAFRHDREDVDTKCTRHLCQAAPRNTNRSRPSNRERNVDQKAQSPIAPRNLRTAVCGHTGHDHPPPGTPALDQSLAVARVEGHIQVGDLNQGPVASHTPTSAMSAEIREASDSLIPLARQAPALNRRPSGPDSVQVGPHDHGEPRQNRPGAGARADRAITTRAESQDPQLQVPARAGRRPRPVPARCSLRCQGPAPSTFVSSTSINAGTSATPRC